MYLNEARELRGIVINLAIQEVEFVIVFARLEYKLTRNSFIHGPLLRFRKEYRI